MKIRVTVPDDKDVTETMEICGLILGQAGIIVTGGETSFTLEATEDDLLTAFREALPQYTAVEVAVG